MSEIQPQIANTGARRFMRAAGPVGLLFAGCYLAQVVSFSLRNAPLDISPMWLPGGLIAGVFIATRPATWWRWAITAALALAASRPFTSIPPLAFVGVIIAALAGAALLARLVQSIPVGAQILPPRRLAMMLIAGGPMIEVLLVIPASFLLWLTHKTSSLGETLAWNSVNGQLSMLFVAPPVAAIIHAWQQRRRPPRRVVLEAVSQWVLLAAAGYCALWLNDGTGYAQALLFLPLPLLLWSALRFHIAGTSIGLLTLALIAFAGAAAGVGPFRTWPVDTRIFALQLNLLAICPPFLFLASLNAELAADTHRRIAAEQRLAEQLRFEELVSDLSSSLASGRPENIDRLLEEALHRISDALAANRALLGRASRQSGELVVRSQFRSTDPPFPPRLSIRELNPWMWRQVSVGEVVFVPDISRLPDEAATDRAYFTGIDLRSLLAVPVFIEGRLSFMLAVGSVGKVQNWPAECVPRLRVLAGVLASAVLRCEAEQVTYGHMRSLQTLATELTRAEERQRRELATVLHDGVGQNLFAATTQLVALRDGRNGAAPTIDKVLGLLDQVTRDTRELTFELCPPALYQLGLGPALRRLVDQFGSRYGIRASLAGDCAGPEDLNARGLAYHAVRELLNNVAKHARAHEVKVRLGQRDGSVEVCVEDDGRGFDQQHFGPSDSGFGLFHLRERIELLGGTLKIESEFERGTHITLLLPLEPARKE